jgi:hypothetical protein
MAAGRSRGGSLISMSVVEWRATATSALRGGGIGLAVWGIFALSLDFGDRTVEEAAKKTTTDITGVEVLGAGLLLGLEIALPVSLLVSVLLAWLVRLRRPWAVPLLATLPGCALFFVVVRLTGYEPVRPWVSAAVLALSFACAALVPPNGRRARSDNPSADSRG